MPGHSRPEAALTRLMPVGNDVERADDAADALVRLRSRQLLKTKRPAEAGRLHQIIRECDISRDPKSRRSP